MLQADLLATQQRPARLPLLLAGLQAPPLRSPPPLLEVHVLHPPLLQLALGLQLHPVLQAQMHQAGQRARWLLRRALL